MNLSEAVADGCTPSVLRGILRQGCFALQLLLPWTLIEPCDPFSCSSANYEFMSLLEKEEKGAGAQVRLMTVSHAGADLVAELTWSALVLSGDRRWRPQSFQLEQGFEHLVQMSRVSNHICRALGHLFIPPHSW
jgi:hypothetical protein